MVLPYLLKRGCHPIGMTFKLFYLFVELFSLLLSCLVVLVGLLLPFLPISISLMA